MNDEKKTTEAEQTKPGDLTASIERMIAVLEAVEHEVREARFLVTGMENGFLKFATLSKALGDIRHVLGPCAIMPEACFHKVYDHFVTANPPLGEVKDALAVADQFKVALDHVLNVALFAQQKNGGPDGKSE